MKTKFLLAAAVGMLAIVSAPAAPRAENTSGRTVERNAELTPTSARKHNARRRAARVYGYIARRRVGGYSYSYLDVVNTYGLTRSLYGSTNTWRDPSLDRQTRSGPFDHDFFFDTRVGPIGNAPYPN
jgi:hypothetical protein